MATFQLFFHLGRAKDLSAPLYKVTITFVHLYHVWEYITDSLVVAAKNEPYLGSLGAAVHCGKDVVRVHGTKHKG